MEKEIKEIRVRIDSLTQLVQAFRNEEYIITKQVGSYSYINHTIDSLQLSKMWLGKVLKELGTSNPYPESKNPNSDKIEPTADKAGVDNTFGNNGEDSYNYDQLNHIQKVKWLRAEIEKVEIEMKSISLPKKYINQIGRISYTKLIEAGMWLGMELGAIRDKEISK